MANILQEEIFFRVQRVGGGGGGGGGAVPPLSKVGRKLPPPFSYTTVKFNVKLNIS